jgi:hypothetical protein
MVYKLAQTQLQHLRYEDSYYSAIMSRGVAAAQFAGDYNR